eukprot:6194335-Pleurochrysis_carterae.AAC.2
MAGCVCRSIRGATSHQCSLYAAHEDGKVAFCSKTSAGSAGEAGAQQNEGKEAPESSSVRLPLAEARGSSARVDLNISAGDEELGMSD